MMNERSLRFWKMFSRALAPIVAVALAAAAPACSSDSASQGHPGSGGASAAGGSGSSTGGAGGANPAGTGGVVATGGAIGSGGSATGGNGGTAGSGQSAGSVLQSNVDRELAPAATDDDLAALVRGNTTFAAKLYAETRKTETGDFFFSPLSISEALAMTYAGARAGTAAQMAAALSFELPQERLHPAFDKLDLALASRGSGAKGIDGKGFRLHVVNAIWGQSTYPFATAFLDVLARDYGAGLRLLDFMNAPEPSRMTINAWVSDQTEGKIPELLAAGTITSDTRLTLTNAVYFNAAWKNVFDDVLTHDADFHRLDGTTKTVSMMAQTATFGLATGAGYSAIELPYDGDQLSMLVVVPDAGKLADVEASVVNGDALATLVAALKDTHMAVGLPRWGVTSSLGLKQPLRALGMTDAFTDAADLSGIDGGVSHLVISDVIHQATVKVNEKGTEAAAATAVVVGTTSVPPSVIVDRPFLFLIRDRPTGSILFIGRVLDPKNPA